MLDDATQLLIHHVKRQTCIHKEDKQRIKQFLRHSLPDMFHHARQDMSDEEEDEEDEDNNHDPDQGGGGDDPDQDENVKTEKKVRGKAKEVEVKLEDIHEEVKEQRVPPQARHMPPDEEYTLLMGNNNWYLFMRLHAILVERLGKIYDQAVIIAAEEGGGDSPSSKESTATALRLKPKNGLNPSDYYPAFLDMVKSVLDGNMDGLAYEDTLREMFGIHAFVAFTLDKVIGNAVRQLQLLVTDDVCEDCWDLYLSEKKSGGTGGPVATAESRYFNELLYQKKAEKLLTDENCFKIVLVSCN
jgi:paired amphipathic helix protein Sin3a